jgi:hypothetical protein
MSDARVRFLEALNCVSEVCDSQMLVSSPPVNRSSMRDSSGLIAKESNALSEKAASLVCKGLMVASFNAFESFVETRWVELLSKGHTNYPAFQDLPEKVQMKMLRNAVAVLGSYHFERKQLAVLKNQLIDVGHFFANVNTGSGFVHPFVARWKGSNITVDELANGLSCLNVSEPWTSMQKIYDVVLKPPSTSAAVNLRQIFKDTVEDRHTAAHEMQTVITRLALSEVPGILRNVAFCFDVLASSAVYLMRTADRAYLSKTSYVKPSLVSKYWEIRKRENDVAAYDRKDPFSETVHANGSVRAKKAELDVQLLLPWVRSKRQGMEFIVELSSTDMLLNWETCI